MVGILMNASVQITNKKEFEELQKRMTTPNTAVNIKETIQNRITPVTKIYRKKSGYKKGGLKIDNILLIL